jgi:hypothetical protein
MIQNIPQRLVYLVMYLEIVKHFVLVILTAVSLHTPNRLLFEDNASFQFEVQRIFYVVDLVSLRPCN